MNPAQYYEAHAAQAQHWSQQMQHYNQWQYQQQWQYHNWQYQQYHLQQQWQRHYLNRGRRDSSRRRKDRTVCQELHPKFEVSLTKAQYLFSDLILSLTTRYRAKQQRSVARHCCQRSAFPRRTAQQLVSNKSVWNMLSNRQRLLMIQVYQALRIWQFWLLSQSLI